MSAGGTFSRVLEHIRSDVLAGRYLPGGRLEPHAIAREIGVSITPVREALQRLTGEGLIESGPDDGFRLGLPLERDLTAQLDWARDLALLCLQAVFERGSESVPPLAFDGRLDELLLSLAARTGNEEYRRAMSSALDRLRRYSGRLEHRSELARDLHLAVQAREKRKARSLLTRLISDLRPQLAYDLYESRSRPL